MKFRGLPADMKIGCLDIRPKTRTSLPLLPCGFCKFFHTEYFMCELGHVTCRDCGTDELNKVYGDKVDSACFGCGTRMSMRRVQITAAQLRDELWFCPCGAFGTLRDLHVHSRDAKYIYGCVLLGKSAEEMELNHFKRSFFPLEKFRDIIEFAEDKLGLFFNQQLMKSLRPNQPKLDDIRQIEHYIAICSHKLESVKAVLRDVNEMNHEMIFTLEAIFRKDSWVFLKLVDVLSVPQNTYRCAISGIPVGLYTRHEFYDGQLWVGLFLRGCKAEAPKSSLCPDTYPLKVRVNVRLHDRHGFTVAQGSFATYDNGEYLSPSFKDPTVNDADYIGVPKLILLEDLQHQYDAVDGKMCFSIRLDPLYIVE